MQTITFECEVITPMFLAGADGTTPELRAPSIKGALRFWWRAMNGHLSIKELKEQEGKIFGDTNKRSLFTLRVNEIAIKRGEEKPVPHKNYPSKCILAGSTFSVTFSMINENDHWNMQKCKALFELSCLIGDFGKRARRGMGSVDIIGCSDKNWAKNIISLNHILELIKPFSKHYTIQNDAIYNTYNGRMELYPWIKQIQLGRADNSILRKISDTTHFLKERNPYTYEPSLGHAFKGRFASPIYVATVKGSLKPIITTLNTVPDRGRDKIDRKMQEEFKNRIL